MSMSIPAGHRIVCPTCDGSGSHLRDRAALIKGTNRIGTAVVQEHCLPCEGTGWIPPRHSEPQPGSDGQEPQE